MSRKSLLRIVVTVLAVVMLLCLSVFSVSAAPPAPAPPVPPVPTPVPPAPPPAAPPVPPAPPYGYPVHHVVQWGENLTRIARRYGTSVWAIAQANGIWNINLIRTGQVLVIPVPGPAPGPWGPWGGYIVQPGDTLSGIAWRFGTTVWAVAQANGIWNPHLIYVGQRLYIP